MLYGIDISHYQDVAAPINFDLLRGHVDFVISKVTEGLSYTDPTATAHVSETRRIGAIPGVYHFARGNDPALEAGFFMAHAPDLAGAFVALDWEISYPSPVSWSLQWLTAIKRAIGTAPLVYLNKSAIANYDWSSVVSAGFGLWEANYDGNPADFSVTGEWPCVAIKQYSDSASIPGISGAVDADSFNGSADQLRRYCVPLPPAPTPPPLPPAPVSPWLSLPSLTYGMRNNASVRSLQHFLALVFPAYAKLHGPLPATGNYLDITAAWVKEYQSRYGIKSDGKDVGPLTKPRLWSDGWRG